MKKVIVPVLFATAFALVFTSCGSTPKKDPVSELQDDVKDIEDQTTDVIEQIAAVDNTAALEKTEAARQAALDAGADKIAAEQFKVADSLYDGLKSNDAAGVDLSVPLADVEKRYAALEKYAKALEAKKKIEEKNLSSYDKESYDAGCTALSDFENLNSSTNLLGTLMFDKASMANGKFINVLNKAYKQLAKDARVEAFKAKRNADSVKAGVAAKAEYTKAVEEFKAGDTNYAMQNAEVAFNHYLASTQQFNSVYATVSEKRAAAQAAIDAAKAQVAASENYALNADQVKPLKGDKVEGIEEEDAVLLEEDKYEAPETQEAEISEEISDFEVQEYEGKDSSLESLVNDAVDKLNSLSSGEAK